MDKRRCSYALAVGAVSANAEIRAKEQCAEGRGRTAACEERPERLPFVVRSFGTIPVEQLQDVIANRFKIFVNSVFVQYFIISESFT